MRIQTKTALLFTGLTAGMMLLLSLLVYFFATRLTFRDFKKRLQLRAVIAANVNLEQDETSTIAFNELRQKHIESLPNQKEYFLLVDSVSKKVQLNPELHLPKSFFQSVMKDSIAFYDKGGTSYVGLHYPDNQGEFIVITSAENEYATETLKNLRTVFLSCMVGSMCIAFTVGLFFSRKTFQPVRRIIAQMRNITAQNLHLRLPETNGKDEIGELTHTFNNMLDRLETAFETQNNFISNASHELSTPLTTVIGEAELALSRKRSTDEYEAAITIILQEADRLRQLTSGLLNLAQSSFSTVQQNQEVLGIDDLLADVKNATSRIDANCILHLEEQNDSETGEEHTRIRGNRQLLTLALSNIVMNACKYSNKQPVSMKLSFQHTKRIQVMISDKGIGIPEKDLPHIFSPFFRASNTGQVKGYGIGLPLSAAILRQHQASIDIHSKEGIGTDVIIEFPVAGLS